MTNKTLKELEEKLKKQKQVLEQELSRFAQKDEKLKDDWDTKYPKVDGATGSSALEDAANQVEAYVNLLPVEHDMELRLQSVKLALEKIKKGKYGQCEKCKKDIDEKRLKVYPEAHFCVKCDKK